MRSIEEIKKAIEEHYDKMESVDDLNSWNENLNQLNDELKMAEKLQEEEKNSDPKIIAEKKKEKENQEIKNLAESGIGNRYLQVDIHSYIAETEEQKTAIEIIKQFITNPIEKNLWLVGVAGTGKTLLGAIICRYCGAKYYKSYQIKDELEYARSFNAKKKPTELINDYADISVMIIDEVGRYRSPAEQEYLFRILNERYEMKKPTVLISNMEKKEFGEYLGAPVVDRFREGCKCLEFKGESYRARERNEWDGKINEKIFD